MSPSDGMTLAYPRVEIIHRLSLIHLFASEDQLDTQALLDLLGTLPIRERCDTDVFTIRTAILHLLTPEIAAIPKVKRFPLLLGVHYWSVNSVAIHLMANWRVSFLSVVAVRSCVLRARSQRVSV
jgi:hypothetical protein